MPRSLCRTRSVVALAFGAGLLLSLSCASDPEIRRDSTTSSTPRSNTGPSLNDLAEKESASQQPSSQPTTAMFLPDWVDPSAITPLSTDALTPESPSQRSLASIVSRRIASQQPNPEAAAAPSLAAVRLYVSGRLKLADGKFEDASLDFEEAARLDPAASEPLRELAVAQAAKGQRASSMATLRRAIERGLADPDALRRLGRDEMRQQKWENALDILSRAANFALPQDGGTRVVPTGLERLVAADLAEALANLGYHTAAREATRVAATPGPAAASTSRFRAENLELDRRAADLWTRRGNLALQIQLPLEAAADFALAASHTPADPVTLSLHHAVAFVRSGRPASAAKVVMDSIAASGGAADPRQVRALAQLAGPPDINEALLNQLRSLTNDRALGSRATGRVTRALAAGLAPSAAQSLLRDRLIAAPDDFETLVALLERHPPTDSAARAADVHWFANRHPLSVLDAAATVTTLGRDLDGLLARFATEDPTDQLLGVALTAASGSSAQSLENLRSVPASARTPAFNLLALRIAMAMGDWPLLEESLAQLSTPQSLANADGPLARVLALAAAQHFTEAAPLAESRIDALGSSAQASDFLLAANIARSTGQFSLAAEILARALDVDPSDERMYASLSTIYGPEGPIADPARFNATGRAARTHVPGSNVLRLFQFRDLVARRQWSQAESLLRSLIEPGSENNGLLEGLVDLWGTMGEADARSLEPALAWITQRREGRKDAPELLLANARLLAILKRAPEAEQLLIEATAQRARPNVERLLIDLLGGPLNRREESIARLTRSIGSQPRRIEDALAWANNRVAQGDWTSAGQALTEIPEAIEFTTAQSASMLEVLSRGAARTQPLPVQQQAAALACFDAVVARKVPLTRALHASRLRILCAQNPLDPTRIIAAIVDAATLGEETGRAALGEALDLLLKRSEPAAALAVIAETVGGSSTTPDPDLVGFWLQLAVNSGGAADAERLVRAFETSGPIRAILDRLDNRIAPAPASATDAGVRAELAFVIGNDWTAIGRDADANSMFRLALSLDPDHGWAANNLGYALLEIPGDLSEAEQLLEMAARIHPDEASVVDSLAWLRYKQGRMLDTLEANPLRSRGAITLLRRAILLPNGAENPDLHDHLGDALFRTNDTTNALLSWQTSLDLVTNDIARARTLNVPPTFVSRLLESARLTRSKISAVAAGTPPKVAPLAADPVK